MISHGSQNLFSFCIPSGALTFSDFFAQWKHCYQKTDHKKK